jgi:ABC-type sugar transport system ATPase subunit
VASLDFDHITKRFKADVVALDDMCLHVADGEFMILLGPSGCGKSTALRVAAGVEAADEGAIRIDDIDMTDVPSRNRDVAMVFQAYALYPHMSVFDNIAFGLRMQGLELAAIGRRVAEVAEMLGLGPVLGRKPRELSGGEQQRVALGRAIVREPQVFLFDEPLSSLDAQLRVQMRLELRRIHRDLHATFLYVTHDQVEAMTMGDRIAVMNGGRVEQVGRPREIYDRPADVFVAGLVGSPGMNLTPVRIEGRLARASGFEVELPSAVRLELGILGFRPEAMSPLLDDRWPRLNLNVDLTEILGSDQYVYGSVGGDHIIARVDPSLKLRHGDSLQLCIRPQALHLFDAVSGKTIL